MYIKQISLADTVGTADSARISDLTGAIISKYDHLEIGVHLHSRPESAVENLLAAYDAGARRFDSTIGGLGGCRFAQDSLVGNISTENVLAALMQRDADIPLKHSIAEAAAISSEIAAQYGL
jgi:hydroxymethylglutaryl-CoA lyase